MMSPLKRPPELLSSMQDQQPSKLSRVESKSPSSARKRLSSSARTGQACDRCKIRKIRCDARPGGCSPCAQSNAECKTTDRLTGRATSRGHIESVESENVILRQQLADLRRQLHEHGINPGKGSDSHRDSNASFGATANSNDGDAASAGSDMAVSRPNDPHSLASILNPAPDSPIIRPNAVLPEYDPDSIGDNYLGVSSANDWPCPASGACFSLFGMKLDLKDFVCNEDEDVAKLTTYNSFFDYAFDEPTIDPPPLPSYKDTRVFCEYWFKLGGSWLPVLHKPDFLAMVHNLHHDPHYKMTDSETVQLHCMIAIIQYQLKIRTGMPSQYDWSHHYRYAVSFWRKLIRSSDQSSIQALLMIVCCLRNFQRPGAYWIISAQVLLKVIEAGYHRSVRAWRSDDTAFTPHELEMRKRIFWSILQCHASLAVRLGRPMLVRLDDFDVELPQVINDNLPEENDLPEYRKCSFLAAVTFFKLLTIQLQIYGQLLSIRPPRQDYEQLQKRLNRQLDYWVTSIPSHLTGTSQMAVEDKTFKLYLSFAHQGARLLLHHPAFLRKSNEALMKHDLDACLDASRQLLSIGKQLKALNLLDATWHNATYYFNAIFTTLFAHTYRKDTLTITQLTLFKSEMAEWLDVMSEIGSLLGSGDRLPVALRVIIGTTTSDLERSLRARLGLSDDSSWSTPRPGLSTEASGNIDTGSIVWASHKQDVTARSNMDYNSSQPQLKPYPTSDHSTHTIQNEASYSEQYQEDMKYRYSALAQSALTTQPSGGQDNTAATFGLSQQQNPYQYLPTSYAHQPSRSAWHAFADNVSSTMQEPMQQDQARHDSANTGWTMINPSGGQQKSKSASPVATVAAATPYTGPTPSQHTYAWDGMPQNLINWQGSKEV